MNDLFHYTCSHSMPGIRHDRALRPNPHPCLRGHAGLVWLTDLETPVRTGLGLTSTLITCDRTEYRVEVGPVPEAIWWPQFARTLPQNVRNMFEAAPGALPMHWWVAETHIAINTILPTGEAAA